MHFFVSVVSSFEEVSGNTPLKTEDNNRINLFIITTSSVYRQLKFNKQYISIMIEGIKMNISYHF